MAEHLLYIWHALGYVQNLVLALARNWACIMKNEQRGSVIKHLNYYIDSLSLA